MTGVVDREAVIESLARRIVELRLETIALFFLETIGPMGRVWSQVAMLYLQPLLILLGRYGDALLDILRDPVAVERLVKRIEELSEERRRERG